MVRYLSANFGHTLDPSLTPALANSFGKQCLGAVFPSGGGEHPVANSVPDTQPLDLFYPLTFPFPVVPVSTMMSSPGSIGRPRSNNRIVASTAFGLRCM